MDPQTAWPDLRRLQDAIRRVQDTAKAKSTLLDVVAERCADERMEALREAHLCQLDAIQALVASLELFERRLAAGAASIARPPSTPCLCGGRPRVTTAT